MHQKVAEKNAQTHLTNVIVLVAHAFEEAEDAYKIAPTGSTLEVTARHAHRPARGGREAQQTTQRGLRTPHQRR
jgi:hypothetical protein